MIVCVVEDLIFSIKISTAAKHLGVDMYFERSKDRVLQTVREKQPSLVIFDLNSAKLAPIEMLAAAWSSGSVPAANRSAMPNRSASAAGKRLSESSRTNTS